MAGSTPAQVDLLKKKYLAIISPFNIFLEETILPKIFIYFLINFDPNSNPCSKINPELNPTLNLNLNF